MCLETHTDIVLYFFTPILYCTFHTDFVVRCSADFELHWAQAMGLGTRITTTHLREEQKVKDWLGIPDHVETVCLTPLGYPRGRFGPTDRLSSTEVSSFNRYGER